MAVPKKVRARVAAGLKKFQPILATAKSRDDGEADTVMIILDMLEAIFGYDKYSEITAECAIRGTYCDLATKIDGVLQCLIEVKAIGTQLKDPHVKQAVDYATNQGLDWVVLTNGITWRIYHVAFTKPINQELVVEFDICELSHRSDCDIEKLFLLCKEGWLKSVLGDFHTQKQALSRYFLGAIVMSDPVVGVIRRELRRVSPDVKIDADEIKKALASEVIKREVLDGDQADHARKKINRAANKAAKQKAEASESDGECEPEPVGAEAE